MPQEKKFKKSQIRSTQVLKWLFLVNIFPFSRALSNWFHKKWERFIHSVKCKYVYDRFIGYNAWKMTRIVEACTLITPVYPHFKLVLFSTKFQLEKYVLKDLSTHKILSTGMVQQSCKRGHKSKEERDALKFSWNLKEWSPKKRHLMCTEIGTCFAPKLGHKNHSFFVRKANSWLFS